jgi:hypothetical protein
MANRFSFVTDTATMCVFDLTCLKHRLGDDADWWSIPREEMAEVNDGNVAFLGLGEDGRYEVTVVDEPLSGDFTAVNLKCPSGRFFIGCGEEVSSDGLEPEGIRGGGFLVLPTGNYRMSAKHTREGILVHFQRLGEHGGDLRNAFHRPVRLAL